MRVPYYVQGRGLWVRCWEEEVLGLELLRVELPRCRPGAARRVQRWLFRAGYRRVLNPPPGRPCSGPCPKPVETAPLYRARGAEVALCLLQQRGLEPERCVVGLRCRRWNRDLERIASALAPQVRGLALCLESQSAELRAEAFLRRSFGLPVFQGEGDICICFTPAPDAPGRVLLGTPRPDVKGLRLGWAGGALPEDVPRAALLTLLAQEGRIGWEEILVSAENGDSGTKGP